MAWQVSKRVWDSIKTEGDNKKDIDASERLMLLALADKADESGICLPKYDTSYQTLGDMVGVNRRSAMRLVDNLAQAGHIWKSETVGRGHSNTFIITIGLSEAEIKDRLALIGVTGDTIKESEKVLPETPISEPEKEMVLPVTQKGVMDDTNKALNGVTDNTQSILKSPSIPDSLPKGNSGQEPPNTKNKDSPPVSVLAYRSIARRYPDKATWSIIAEAVGDNEADLQFWEEVVTAWITKGFKKINIDGMLDWFKKKEIPKGAYKNGHKPQSKNQTKQPGPISRDEWEREINSL